MRLLLTRRRLLGMAALAGVGAVAFAAWPRGPRLERYTSSPLHDHYRHIMRLQALVPASWVRGEPPTSSPHDPDSVMLEPPDPPRWMPDWLAGILRPKEHRACMFLAATDEGQFEVAESIQLPTNTLPNHCASMKSGPTVVYYRAETAEFEATHRQICKSFRVIPGERP